MIQVCKANYAYSNISEVFTLKCQWFSLNTRILIIKAIFTLLVYFEYVSNVFICVHKFFNEIEDLISVCLGVADTKKRKVLCKLH